MSVIKKADHLLDEKKMGPELRRSFRVEYAKALLTQRIAELRKKSRLNQKDLALKLGVSQQVISRIETGVSDNLTIDTLVQLAGALGHKVRISFHKTLTKAGALEVA